MLLTESVFFVLETVGSYPHVCNYDDSCVGMTRVVYEPPFITVSYGNSPHL